MPHPLATRKRRREPLARAIAAGTLLAGTLLSGCTVLPPPDGASWPDTSQHAPYGTYGTEVEPAMYPPETVFIPMAPPPAPREVVPVMPFAGTVWIGGYWAWQNQWVWAPGRWARPPSTYHRWAPPHYERQGSGTRYIPGYWTGPRTPERPAWPARPSRPETWTPRPREAWDHYPEGRHPFNPPSTRPQPDNAGQPPILQQGVVPPPNGQGRANIPPSPPLPAPVVIPPPRNGRILPVPPTARPNWENRAPGTREEDRNGRAERRAPDPSDRLP